MNNSQIRRLEDDIIDILNGSTVPIEVKRLILKDVLSLVTAKADSVIQQECLQPITESGELEAKDAEST